MLRFDFVTPTPHRTPCEAKLTQSTACCATEHQMALLCRCIGAALLAASASALYIPAASPSVKWTGRIVANASTGAVAFDWEGVSASVSLTNVSYVIANITDLCGGTGVGGGSRWLVTITTSNPKTMEPNHRVSTFFSGPLLSMYYLFNNPGQRCDPDCDFSGSTTFTLTRLTESRLSGCSLSAGLSVNGFETDGAVSYAWGYQGRAYEPHSVLCRSARLRPPRPPQRVASSLSAIRSLPAT